MLILPTEKNTPKVQNPRFLILFGKPKAGKTTLLSLLAGLDVPTNGQIFYNGEDLSKISRDKYRANEIGVIFQSYNLLSHLTALENVILTIDISQLNIKVLRE